MRDTALMASRRSVLAVAAVAAVVAVGVAGVMLMTGREPPVNAVALPTSEWNGGGGDSAQIEGYVLPDELGCLQVYPAPDRSGPGYPIQWPKGYYATESQGVLIVHNGSGHEVVREGGTISAGGGYQQMESTVPSCAHVPEDAEWAVIQSNLP